MGPVARTVALLFVLFWSLGPAAASGAATAVPPDRPMGEIVADLLRYGYSGSETMTYDVSWTGGIKIGEVHLAVKALKGPEEYEIRAEVTTAGGAIHYLYPVDDLHVTRVRGPRRLPFHYEIWQQEGYNYRAHRVLEFDQERHRIVYTKNDKPEGVFQVDGETNNEFSSFLNSRLMRFEVGSQFIVPTFADKKRNLVLVKAVARKRIDNDLLGPVITMEVAPVMKFKGLYDKQGDTVIWYTDDECRVPVRINSKIVIGSLTAELVAYDNPGCGRYSGSRQKTAKNQ